MFFLVKSWIELKHAVNQQKKILNLKLNNQIEKL